MVGVLPQLLALCTFYCRRKKNAVIGKDIAIVVVLGADKVGCREQIQNLLGGMVVQAALPSPLPYCLLKITGF